MRVFIDEIKNGKEGATSPESSYFRSSSDSNPGAAYDVTVNYVTGHWCTCRGNLSKKGSFSRRGEKQSVLNAAHWCKHVKAVLSDSQLLDDGIENRAEQTKSLEVMFADTLPALKKVTA